ncbi:HMG-Y-related protein A-like [Silene latifolia]|uniref:HMG-Y-related protein A-like n=1 Tax=Silene latifolia TaxID=37657 RepID=UPI003D78642B
MAFADLSTNSVVDYNQMIMEAIEELNSNEGANITEINNYIESNYPDLPPAHSSLLSNTLDKLRLSGHLTYSNNIFSKPDSNPNQNITPAKRGRGRPPKPKSDTDPISPAAYTGTPRPRGRPPKVVDPLAPPPQPKVKPTSSGRGRGRPRKDPLSVAVPVPVSVSGVKRGRGRPRKST